MKLFSFNLRLRFLTVYNFIRPVNKIKRKDKAKILLKGNSKYKEHADADHPYHRPITDPHPHLSLK